MKASSLYNEVIDITHVYLGPAADRFIARQVHNHLGKEPDKLTQKDLLSLIDWIGMAVSLITDDQRIIEQYLSDLKKLTKPKRKAK